MIRKIRLFSGGIFLPSIGGICRGAVSSHLVIAKEYCAGDIDIVDLMEYNSLLLLKYDKLKSVGLGGPLWDPPLEPKT